MYKFLIPIYSNNKKQPVVKKWIWIALLAIVSGCSDQADSDSGGTGVTYTLYISNKSQFEIQEVYVYEEHLTYYDASVTSMISAPLAIDDDIEAYVEGGKHYYVTVIRPPNQYSDPLAYTTAYPISLTQDSTLIYFDSQYRLEYNPPN